LGVDRLFLRRVRGASSPSRENPRCIGTPPLVSQSTVMRGGTGERWPRVGSPAFAERGGWKRDGVVRQFRGALMTLQYTPLPAIAMCILDVV
jgi:hypothetical protein